MDLEEDDAASLQSGTLPQVPARMVKLSSGVGRREDPHPTAMGQARTNHLGVSISATGRSRIKYARSVTILFESNRADSYTEASRLALLREIRKLHTFSVPTLLSIFRSFARASRPGQTLIGPRTFRLIMLRNGILDTVIHERLFLEFADKKFPDRLDFRAFLRVLCLLADDPLEVRQAGAEPTSLQPTCTCATLARLLLRSSSFAPHSGCSFQSHW